MECLLLFQEVSVEWFIYTGLNRILLKPNITSCVIKFICQEKCNSFLCPFQQINTYKTLLKRYLMQNGRSKNLRNTFLGEEMIFGLDPLDGVVTVMMGVDARSLAFDALGCKILLEVSLPLVAMFKFFLLLSP